MLLPRVIRALLADLTDTEVLEVSRWHSLAGEPLPDDRLHTRPPSQSLHPDSTITSILGSTGTPGLLTLAHRGVLTVEDLPEFSAPTVDALRPALTDATVTIATAGGSVSRPAGARIVFTAQDCPGRCLQVADCRCTAAQRARYLARIPRWLLARTDLFVQQVTVAAPDPSLPSLASVRDGVTRARERARRRWGTTPEPGAEARYAQAVAGVPRNAIRELDDAVDLGHLSIRTATRCLRLAWTLADLDDWPHPSIAAIHYILAGRQRAHQLLRTPAPR